MEAILIAGGVTAVMLALVGVGMWVHAHITNVANAASRATTISSGDVATLNAKLDNLGNVAQTIAGTVSKAAVAGVNAADKATS